MCLLHLLSMTEKRKEPKARICLGLSSGGEKGIRTLEALSTLTRFPVVRLRPAQPSLRAVFALTKTLYHLLFALSSKKCIFLTTTTKMFAVVSLLFLIRKMPGSFEARETYLCKQILLEMMINCTILCICRMLCDAMTLVISLQRPDQ